MVVRHAQPQDAEQIQALAESLRFDSTKQQPKGFLVYALDTQAYRDRICASPYFYVATQEPSQNNIGGFLMCYNGKTLRALIEEGKMPREDKLARFVANRQEPYIFGDQVGVEDDKARTKIGDEMMGRLFVEMELSGVRKMYAPVLRKPVSNDASAHFVASFGFHEIGEVETDDGFIWSVHELDIKK